MNPRKRTKAASASVESITSAPPAKKRSRTDSATSLQSKSKSVKPRVQQSGTDSVKPRAQHSRTDSVRSGVVLQREPRCPEATAVQRGTCSALAVGEGDAGQLGLGQDVMDCQRFRPVTLDGAVVVEVAAGSMHSVCLTAEGKVYCFGCNDESALGYVTEEEDAEFRPVSIPGLPDRIVQIAAGDSFSGALSDDGRVFLWGTYRDSSGQIGLMEPGVVQRTPSQLQLPVEVVQLVAGSNHVVMLTAQGHVYTAGNGEQGQLGRVAEMFSQRGGRRGLEYLLTADRVYLGGRNRRLLFDRVWAGTFCSALRAVDSGQVFLFGLNNYCQLALETKELIVWTPTLSRAFSQIKVEQFVGSLHHSIVRDSCGAVYTLGRYEDGRLGVPDLTCDLQQPTVVPALAGVVCCNVSASGYVSMAVSTAGDLYTWGMGTTGQLGHGDDEDRTQPATVQGKHIKDKKVLMVSAGGTHTLALVVASE